MIKNAFFYLLAGFIFVLPIPGTIALRHALLVMLLILALIVVLREKTLWRETFSSMRWLVVLHGLMLVWIIGQAWLISAESDWALKEIRGQWVPALTCLAVGVGGALLSRVEGEATRPKILTLIVVTMVLQSAFSILVTVPEFMKTGIFPQGKTAWTAGKLEISYWNNMALAFLAVDLLSHLRHRTRLTELKLIWVVCCVVLLMLSNILFGARNGIIGSMMLLFSLAALVMWRERKALGGKRSIAFLLLLVALIGGMAFASYKTDARWQRFLDTANVAWDIKSHDAWLHPDDGNYPKTTSGAEVELSAYLRISWIRASVDLIANNPLGVGYGRNAFGHALRQTQDTRLGHAHSGIIDWTIGVGLPGLLLWLALMGWMAWNGVGRYFQRNDVLGLVIVFVTGGFFGRMFLDSINRDHMLMLFFLISAMLIALPDKQTAP